MVVSIGRKSPKEGRIERQIITGMVIDTQFLKGLAPLYRENLFSVSYAKVVADWCIEYFNKYDEAPKVNIQDILLTKSENELEETEANLIGSFVDEIIEEYKDNKSFNTKFFLDKAENYFRIRSLKNINKQLSRAINNNNIEYGESIVKDFKRVARPESIGIDPIGDMNAITKAFTKDSANYLFTMPGDFGKALGPIERGCLIAILGNQKAGKTQNAQQFALNGVFAGYNVLLISMEMSEEKMLKRIHQNLSGCPSYTKDIFIPVFDCLNNQKDTCNFRKRLCSIGLPSGEKTSIYDDIPEEYVPCTICKDKDRKKYEPAFWGNFERRRGLSLGKAKKKGMAITRSLLGNKRIKFIEFPSGSITVSKLKVYLDNWEYYEGFVPDIIITDYADKFAPEDRKKSRREQIIETWQMHKALAQERHCVVITPSQANTLRTGKQINSGSWAEAIDKIGIIDIGYGWNCYDKDKGIYVVNILASRNDSFNEKMNIYVLSCLDISKPFLDSFAYKEF